MSWLERLRRLLGTAPQPPPPVSPGRVTPAPVLVPDREDEARRAALEALGKDQEDRPRPPSEPRAMCYSVAMPPPVAEYVCSACAKRTQYSSLSVASQIELMLPALRAEAKKISGLEVSLDETEFCHHCRKAPKQGALGVTLVVRFAGAEHRHPGVTVEDLQFIARRKKLKRKELPRLEALIGRAAAEKDD